MTASISSNSQSTYKNALTAFMSFRKCYSLPQSFPAPIGQITLFISYCFELGYAPSTISTYLSGISFHHKIKNFKDPTSAFVVKKLMEGCRRTRKQVDLRAPITGAILRRICNVLPNVCNSPYECSLFKAAYLVSYFGLMRVSEVVFTNQLHEDRPLFNSDIQVMKGSKALRITIRFSKTNQRGPPTTLRIPASGDPTLCIVAAVLDYIRYRPMGPKYFFCHANGYPLTRSQFSGVLAKTMRSLGLPTQIYTAHSFRIGRASVLAAQGISNEVIKRLGRWKSDVFERYIRLN